VGTETRIDPEKTEDILAVDEMTITLGSDPTKENSTRTHAANEDTSPWTITSVCGLVLFFITSPSVRFLFSHGGKPDTFRMHLLLDNFALRLG
jgi:hypothetical protein